VLFDLFRDSHSFCPGISSRQIWFRRKFFSYCTRDVSTPLASYSLRFLDFLATSAFFLLTNDPSVLQVIPMRTPFSSSFGFRHPSLFCVSTRRPLLVGTTENKERSVHRILPRRQFIGLLLKRILSCQIPPPPHTSIVFAPRFEPEMVIPPSGFCPPAFTPEAFYLRVIPDRFLSLLGALLRT